MQIKSLEFDMKLICTKIKSPQASLGCEWCCCCEIRNLSRLGRDFF